MRTLQGQREKLKIDTLKLENHIGMFKGKINDLKEQLDQKEQIITNFKKIEEQLI